MQELMPRRPPRSSSSPPAASRLHARRDVVGLSGPVRRLLFGLQSSVAGVEEDDEAAGEQSAQSCHHHGGHWGGTAVD